MKEISVLGIDLAKHVFQLHGNDRFGHAILKRRLKRGDLKAFIANLPPCLIGMEACGGAHYWAREFQKHGHEVRLISPQFVKPFVKSNKNDANDAEAIAEAVSRPSMRFVSVKQEWQQDIQNLHRVRQRLVHDRTALGNQIRGFLHEYGYVIPKRVHNLVPYLSLILDDSNFSPLAKKIFQCLLDEFKALEIRIEEQDQAIRQVFKTNEIAQKIGQIEGIGVITATAIAASVGDPKTFKNGRQFSAWLGLVPKQSSSGGKDHLLGISKRGDVYLRSLLIHGARSVVLYASRKTDRRSLWIQEKEKTRGFNRACVAVANKNARVIWALLARNETYRKAA